MTLNGTMIACRRKQSWQTIGSSSKVSRLTNMRSRSIPRWGSASFYAPRHPCATVTGVPFVGVAHDITEMKKLQEQSEVVHRELNHRLKNSLAVVQAIAWKTLSHDVALEQFQKRLASYGRTQ